MDGPEVAADVVAALIAADTVAAAAVDADADSVAVALPDGTTSPGPDVTTMIDGGARVGDGQLPAMTASYYGMDELGEVDDGDNGGTLRPVTVSPDVRNGSSDSERLRPAIGGGIGVVVCTRKTRT